MHETDFFVLFFLKGLTMAKLDASHSTTPPRRHPKRDILGHQALLRESGIQGDSNLVQIRAIMLAKRHTGKRTHARTL